MTAVLQQSNLDRSNRNLNRPMMAKRLSDKLKRFDGAPLIVVSGPSGSGKTGLIANGLIERLKGMGGSDVECVQMPLRDCCHSQSAVDLCNLVIENHPAFKSRKSSSVFREKMTRSVERDPVETASKLREMMQEYESESFAPKDLKLVVCLDAADQLVQKNLKDSSDLSKIILFGNHEAPLGFLDGLLGMTSIVFALTYRDWTAEMMDLILSDIDESKTLIWNLNFPKSYEISSIVESVLQPVKNQAGKKFSVEVEKLSKRLVGELKANPSSAVFLSEYIEELLGDGKGLKAKLKSAASSHCYVDFIAEKWESMYDSQSFYQQLAQKEVIFDLNDSNISMIKTVFADDLVQSVEKIVNDRFVYVDGSDQELNVKPVHKSIFKDWSKLNGWLEDEDDLGLSHLKNFAEKAMAWEVGDRSRDLLVTDTDELSQALRILEDENFKKLLDPTTNKFLSVSTAPPKDYKKLIKKAILPVGAGVVVLTVAATMFNRDSSDGVVVGKEIGAVISEQPIAIIDEPGIDADIKAEVFPKIDVAKSVEGSAIKYGIIPSSSWNDILTVMERVGASEKSASYLDVLSILHTKAVAYPQTITELDAEKFKRLMANLGEIAKIQNDRLAVQSVWKYEMDGTDSNGFSSKFRLIMARLALNEGRKHEAVAYVENAHIQETTNPFSVDFVEAALNWHFKERQEESVSSDVNSEQAAIFK